MRNFSCKYLLLDLTLLFMFACSKPHTPSAATGEENGYEYVDLGLSVKWATCNLCASFPEDEGNRYAWGEVYPNSREIYLKSKIRDRSSKWLSEHGYINESGILNLEYDAANYNRGGNWRIPTPAEWNELETRCKWEWIEYNNVEGALVTGPNGKSIFLPKVVSYDALDQPTLNISNGYYQTSMVYTTNISSMAYVIYNDKFNCGRATSNLRSEGLAIRPVFKNSEEYVDLGLSVKWATCNIGANAPDDYGYYYAWGEYYAKKNYNDLNSETYNKNVDWLLSNGYIDKDNNITKEFDPAQKIMGGKWRMPTEAEWKELCDNCFWQEVFGYDRKGYVVTGRNGNNIFIPRAGKRYKNQLQEDGAYYWTSTVDYNNPSTSISFYGKSDSKNPPKKDNASRYYGFPIRAVHE